MKTVQGQFFPDWLAAGLSQLNRTDKPVAMKNDNDVEENNKNNKKIIECSSHPCLLIWRQESWRQSEANAQSMSMTSFPRLVCSEPLPVELKALTSNKRIRIWRQWLKGGERCIVFFKWHTLTSEPLTSQIIRRRFKYLLKSTLLYPLPCK